MGLNSSANQYSNFYLSNLHKVFYNKQYYKYIIYLYNFVTCRDCYNLRDEVI